MPVPSSYGFLFYYINPPTTAPSVGAVTLVGGIASTSTAPLSSVSTTSALGSVSGASLTVVSTSALSPVIATSGVGTLTVTRYDNAFTAFPLYVVGSVGTITISADKSAILTAPSPIISAPGQVTGYFSTVAQLTSVATVSALGRIGTSGGIPQAPITGVIYGVVPAITGSIIMSSSPAVYFILSGAIPAIGGNIYGTSSSGTFVISGSLPAFTTVWGYIHGSLPSFVSISETQAVFNGQVTYAMNIKTGETTQYSNYNFLSIIRVGFNYYGVRSDGVYLLGGAYDITAPIPTSFTTAQSTLGSTSIKYVPFLYLDAQNPCMVTQITDNETAGPFYSHPTGLKTKLSRGIKGKIWQFKVNNVQGNQFRIGALEALSEITSHRVK